jgi:hypothetical protein
VPRPFRATQARSPFPSVRAARTDAFRFECVPARKTSAVEKFGIIAVGAKPSARFIRFPIAVRASDARKFRFYFIVFDNLFENFFGFGGFSERRKDHFQPDYFQQIYLRFRGFPFHFEIYKF